MTTPPDDGDQGNALQSLISKIKKGNPKLSDSQAETMAKNALKRMNKSGNGGNN